MKFLLLAAFAWIAWRLFQHYQRVQALKQPPPQEQFEPMQRCASCGTYLPARSLSSDGRCGRCKE